MSPGIQAWLSAFAFTQAVEVPIYVAALRLARDPSRPGWLDRWGPELLVAFGASMITHPVVWFLIPRIPYSSYDVMVVRCEAFAVIVEGLYLWALGAYRIGRGLALSLVANAASVTLGLTSRHFFGWP